MTEKTKRILDNSTNIIDKKIITIAVSAVSGGGKTCVTNELLNLLKPSVPIFFDSYKGDLLGIDYCEWSEAGADANLWNLNPMIHDIICRINENYKYILIDYPFGRAHKGISNLTDFAVFIDTPLDIAFARRIERDYCHRDPSRKMISEPLEHLSEYITFYQRRHRNTYLKHIETVKPTCDMVVDGLDTPLNLANTIIEKLSELLPAEL